MKIFSRFVLPVLFLLTGWTTLSGQDIHYSQMYSTPLYVNPAFTGNHDCNYRAGVNYRQQAASFTVPFETYTAWLDTRFSPKFLRQRGWFGIGGHMYYDNAGDGDLEKVQGMLFTAYSQGFNADNSLYGSLGVGVGVTNRSLNANNLIFGDQWDNQMLEFNLGKTSDDLLNIESSSIFYVDFNLGLSLHHLVNDKWMYEVGGSVSHINTPEESFFGENNNKVGRKFIGHATFQVLLSPYLLIKPEAYYISQQNVNEFLLGANLVYNAMDLKLIGGLWYRWNRDIIPAVGLEYNKFTLLFTYDINVSAQRNASNYQGGFELSLVKKFCARVSTKRQPCKFLEF